MSYNELKFKIPSESSEYWKYSSDAIQCIEDILSQAVQSGRNKIILNTNLKFGLPMENINKIAGPMVEAWAYELFYDVVSDLNNNWRLIHVEACERLNRADVILQFKRNSKEIPVITAEVDVKATSEDFDNSGKSPNITSFARIRTAYVVDADFLFVILSLKHKVYSIQNEKSLLKDAVMEVVHYNVYDLKSLSESDLTYNPALGTGQLQIKDIHYVSTQERTTWEFCQLLDKKYLASSKRSFDDWLALAKKNEWIK